MRARGNAIRQQLIIMGVPANQIRVGIGTVMNTNIGTGLSTDFKVR